MCKLQNTMISLLGTHTILFIGVNHYLQQPQPQHSSHLLSRMLSVLRSLSHWLLLSRLWNGHWTSVLVSQVGKTEAQKSAALFQSGGVWDWPSSRCEAGSHPCPAVANGMWYEVCLSPRGGRHSNRGRVSLSCLRDTFWTMTGELPSWGKHREGVVVSHCPAHGHGFPRLSDLTFKLLWGLLLFMLLQNNVRYQRELKPHLNVFMLLINGMYSRIACVINPALLKET